MWQYMCVKKKENLVTKRELTPYYFLSLQVNGSLLKKVLLSWTQQQGTGELFNVVVSRFVMSWLRKTGNLPRWNKSSLGFQQTCKEFQSWFWRCQKLLRELFRNFNQVWREGVGEVREGTTVKGVFVLFSNFFFLFIIIYGEEKSNLKFAIYHSQA